MDIIPIFVKNYPPEDCHLWAVKYDGEKENEFRRLLNFWSDSFLVSKFLDENMKYFSSDFWQPMTKGQAALQIRDQSLAFDKKFKEIEQLAQKNDFSQFHSIFQILKTSEGLPEQNKAKLPINRGFLRFYGLRMADDRMLITGGGIKLTLPMKGNPVMEKELAKLEKVKYFLKQEQITYLDEYVGE